MNDSNRMRTSESSKQNRTWIAPTAVLIGDVKIGRNTSIWFNSVIHGDGNRVTIGDDSIILENCFIKACQPNGVTVGSRVMVGHRSIIEGCIIQDEAVLGDGVKVMEGAIIGQGALVKPDTVVFKNSVVPPHSLFSGPAEPVRQLTEDEISEMKKKWVTFETHWKTRFSGEY